MINRNGRIDSGANTGMSFAYPARPHVLQESAGSVYAALREPRRVDLQAGNPVDWDSTPTFFEAATIAHGHLLHLQTGLVRGRVFAGRSALQPAAGARTEEAHLRHRLGTPRTDIAGRRAVRRRERPPLVSPAIAISRKSCLRTRLGICARRIEEHTPGASAPAMAAR
jgi:hypothetical protein